MELLGVAALGFAAGFVSALSTGGGLLSLPGLLFFGASPLTAIATSRVSALSGGLTSTYRYFRAQLIDWRYMPLFVLMAVAAGIIGPRIVLTLDQALVQRIIGVTLLLILPVLLLQKDLGAIAQQRHRRHKLAGLVLLGLVMLYGVTIGPGSGILYVYVLIFCFGMHASQANATCTAFSLAGTFSALITYGAAGAIDWRLGIPLLIGAAAGGYLGAHTAIKKGSAWVKWILAVVVVVSGLRLLLFP